MTALLIMGALVLLVCGGMLVYFYSLQTRYYDVVASSLGRVDEIRVVESPTFVAAAGTSADTPPAEPLAIEGNKVIAVGRRSAEFTVVSGAPSPDTEVRWRVEPANAASLAAGADPKRSVSVYPAFPGALTVVASVLDGDGRVTHEGRFETAAVEAPRTAKLELPWVGQGVGTLVVTVLLLGIVLYLAYDRVLEGAVVATLLTAVAGFAFGLRSGAQQS